MAGRRSLSIQTILSIKDKITAPLGKMQASIDRFSRNAKQKINSISRPLEKLSSTISRTAIGIAGAVTGMALGMRKFLRVGTEFEQSIVNAAVKFPEGIERGTAAFEELENAAKKVGLETRFSAAEAAEGFNFLAMAGFSAKQAMAALPGIADLATVANTDLATSADIVSDSLSIMGLMTENSLQLQKNLARTSGVMVKAATSANFTFSELFESFKRGGPVAHAAGIEIETLSGIFAELANSGIKGERAGTSLLNMISRLQAPSVGARRALRRMGTDVFDSTGKMRDMVDIISDLRKGAEKLTPKARAASLAKIFGLQALPAAIVLLETTDKKLRDVIKSFEDSEEVVGDLSKKINDTLRGDLLSLNSAYENVLVQMKEMADSPLRESIQSLTEELRLNGAAIATDLGEAIIKVVKGFIWLIENFEKIIKWAKILIPTFIALKAIIIGVQLAALAAASPFVALIGAITAVVAGIGLIASNWNSIKSKFGFKAKVDIEQPTHTTIPITPLAGIQSRDLLNLNSGRTSAMQRNESIITIKDESGRAEITESNFSGMTLIPTGAL